MFQVNKPYKIPTSITCFVLIIVCLPVRIIFERYYESTTKNDAKNYKQVSPLPVSV